MVKPEKKLEIANVAFPNSGWLGQIKEEAINPEQAIIDAHHHLWARPFRYLLEDYVDDIASGHDIRASVYVECRAMYRQKGPEEFRPLGELEYANGLAAMSASGLYGPTQVNAAIVGHANLALGSRVEPVLAAMRQSSSRFQSVRQVVTVDRDVRVGIPEHFILSADFGQGFACLQRMGLAFEAWLYHPQLSDLIALMRAYPEARVVINHLGGPIGVGRFANRRPEVFQAWRADIAELASFPNVFMKLGGLGMRFCGFDFYRSIMPPTSDELAAGWGDLISAAIDVFGPARCMFESNFPVDKASCSYGVLWNAFKKIAKRYSSAERSDLFFDTAGKFYAIDI